MPIASIKLKRTKILIERPNKYNPKNEAIKLTGKATAGTMTALRFPKNKYMIITTRTNAIISVL